MMAAMNRMDASLFFRCSSPAPLKNGEQVVFQDGRIHNDSGCQFSAVLRAERCPRDNPVSNIKAPHTAMINHRHNF